MILKSRAALVVALFLSLALPYNLFAETRSAKSETYKDIIEKAQNLALQKDRQQAINILSNAIKRESAKSAASHELKKTLNDISTVFFGDKAQQVFEAGVTLKRTDLSQSLQKLNESLRLEPDNFLVQVEVARLYLTKNDCSAAEEILIKLKNFSATFEEFHLVYGQLLACQGKFSEFQKLFEEQDKKSANYKFWQIVEVERLVKDKNISKALDLVSIVQKNDQNYPEAQYWAWKIDQARKKKNLGAAEKYVMSCKNISAHLYRQYMMDPQLCRRLGEVESTSLSE